MNPVRRRVSPGKGPARRALLLAGLFLFRSLTLFADLPPARSVAPGPVAVATPEVRAADLKELRDGAESAARRVAENFEAQARQLSRTAANVVELQTEIKALGQSGKSLESSVAGLGASLGDLDKHLATISQTLAGKEIEAASEGAKLKKLSEDMANLRNETESGNKQVRDGMAEIADLRESLKQRQSKLESLTDLLTILKKDVDNNSEEIVEVKQALKGYQTVSAPQDKSPGDWWELALGWRYMPVLAVGLSLVALGLAAGRK